MNNITTIVERQGRLTLARHGMLRPGERVLVAVSGGPDSRALLDLLHRLPPPPGLDLHVAHPHPRWPGPPPARPPRVRTPPHTPTRALPPTRTRIRAECLPLLTRAHNPGVISALVQAGDLLRDEDQPLDALAKAPCRGIASRSGDHILLPARALRGMPVAMRRRILRLVLAESRGDLRRIDLRHVQQSLALLDEDRSRRRVSLPGGTADDLRWGSLRSDAAP